MPLPWCSPSTGNAKDHHQPRIATNNRKPQTTTIHHRPLPPTTDHHHQPQTTTSNHGPPPATMGHHHKPQTTTNNDGPPTTMDCHHQPWITTIITTVMTHHYQPWTTTTNHGPPPSATGWDPNVLQGLLCSSPEGGVGEHEEVGWAPGITPLWAHWGWRRPPRPPTQPQSTVSPSATPPQLLKTPRMVTPPPPWGSPCRCLTALWLRRFPNIQPETQPVPSQFRDTVWDPRRHRDIPELGQLGELGENHTHTKSQTQQSPTRRARPGLPNQPACHAGFPRQHRSSRCTCRAGGSGMWLRCCCCCSSSPCPAGSSVAEHPRCS